MHYLVVIGFNASQKGTIVLDGFMNFKESVVYITITVILAFPLYLILELPAANIEKLFLPKFQSSSN